MKYRIAAMMVLLLGATPVMASQVGYRGWGPRMGATLGPDQFHFGAHVDLGYFADHLRFQPNAELGLSDDLTLFNMNGDLAYRFSTDWGKWSPYLGGGLGLYVSGDDRGLRHHSSSELGVSALGGIEKSLANGDRFFIETKLGLVDAPDFKIGVGWTFF